MEFHCTHCGCKLTVPATRTGKKGRCPKCKETLTVPNPGAELENPLHDRRLLDLPEPDEAKGPTTESDESAAAYEQFRGALGGRLMDPEEIPERKYPWIIDIFLYPLNLSALAMLLICVGVPFLLRLLVIFCKTLFYSGVQVILIPWLIALMLHWSAEILLAMYMIWYVFVCVRDSARGGIRAPNTTASTPGFGGLFGETFKLFACVVVCALPAAIYGSYRGGADPLFWVLYALSGLTFPMALLSVIMYESLRGLNPLLILRSISRTPFDYLVLVPFCYVLFLMFPLAYALILNPLYWHWSYVLQAVAFYQLLIMAHLLGRFFWKNEEKLDWDA